MKKSIVAIMAHADDIEYSAGATFTKYIAEGYRALYGVLSRCNSGWTVTEEKGGHYISSLEIIPQRRAEAEAAAKLFGAKLYYGDLLENCYTTREGIRITPSFAGPEGIERDQIQEEDVPEGTLLAVASGAGDTWDSHPAISEVADLLVEWEPELVIGQPVGNFNPDHLCAAQIVAIAWRLAVKRAEIGPYWIPVGYTQEGQYPFPPLTPDHFVDVTGYEERCLQAIACHKSQGGHLPSTKERLERKWKAWGEKNGVASAEAFSEVYRKK